MARAEGFGPRNRLRRPGVSNGNQKRGQEPYLVRASLFLFNKLWPVSAPLSLAFISPRDCRVGKTASRSYEDSIVN